MLEKIGLPERPYLRGNNWVIDASHCQGCSSQFTFINRKHHCRRCGGLFCGTCTQQRMYLRGQGDSPVRICDPCKKLEEAAKFELRHGHKKKAAKGSSRLTSRPDDGVLEQILGGDIKGKSTLERDAHNVLLSCPQEFNAQKVDEDKNIFVETTPITPEELRQKALEEKQTYKMLKAEGKPGEALRAFKRAKELERQAAALELSLRKERRRTLSSTSTTEIQKAHDDTSSSGRKDESNSCRSNDKDDLSNDLKELGWSDLDLRDAEKKPATMSLEGELSALLGEVSKNTGSRKTSCQIDKTEVVALKKRALALKREGNLLEAKEQLKKAKILEKQLEEEEFLGGAEESDDELSALIRDMDNDKQDNLSNNFELGGNFNFDQLLKDDLLVDGNFDVTDEDMYDPEMDAALKSLGWEGENNLEDRETLSYQIQSLKREALTQKRAGNVTEAMELLKKAKLLEKELDNNSSTPSQNQLKQYEDEGKKANVIIGMEAKLTPKSRLMIQKELLTIKKRALALRKEGKSNEADEELKKGITLEQQLKEMDNAPQEKAKPMNISHKYDEVITLPDVGDEVEADVTDHDMQDPAYLNLLRNLGWDEENNENAPVQKIDIPSGQPASSLLIRAPKMSKGEIQRELLALKRKALSLRRQGETEEFEEVQKMAKVLEAQLEEMEVPRKALDPKIDKNLESDGFSSLHDNVGRRENGEGLVEENTTVKINYDQRQETVPKKTNLADKSDTVQSTLLRNDQGSLKQQILVLKRNALALKKEGKLAEAKEELRRAKLLEKSSEESNSNPSTSSHSDASSSTPNVPLVWKDQPGSLNSISRPLSRSDRFKLQQESLGHKRLSRKLRMEGRNEEADAEFELAKAIEAQLEESAEKNPGSGSKPVDDLGVEDFLDPQLLSALKSIGIDDAGSSTDKMEPVKMKDVASKAENPGQERAHLEDQIKTEKLKAVALKRSGKQAEALDALRQAKVFEKKLNSLTPA